MSKKIANVYEVLFRFVRNDGAQSGSDRPLRVVLILCRHSKRTELPKPFFGIIIADESSGMFEVCNKGIKSTVLMMR